MKQLLILILLFFVGHFTFGQTEITPQDLQKIKADIEKQIPALKQKLVKEEFTTDEIEFSLDTFRIGQTFSRRMPLDISTMGMKATIDDKTASYDKLMNKYYNKLLKVLKPEDKKVLIAAQKNWLVYRDTEDNLIGMLTKDEYSGGGSIQTIIAAESYSTLVVSRTIQIFSHYDGLMSEK